MVAESNKEIKEELRATIVHLELHRSAPLKGAARTNDQSKIMGSQLGVGVRRVGVGITSRRKDGAALNARFWRE